MGSMKVAINPLQWLASADGWLSFDAAPPLEEAVRLLAADGFVAMQADVPEGMAAAEFRATLAGGGLEPATGFFAAHLEDASRREEIVAAAGEAAAQQAALGLTEIVVSADMERDAPRVAVAAVGAEPDEARLGEIATTLEQVGEATLEHGVTACLHPHVGSWIEVEEEIEHLLAAVSPELLALAPDTGHLAWAGVDPVELTLRHRDRVRAVHVKDMRADVAERHRAARSGYRETVLDGLWTEPGRGDLDLDGVLAALPPDFPGWVVIEVDRPDLEPPAASLAACAEWARGL